MWSRLCSRANRKDLLIGERAGPAPVAAVRASVDGRAEVLRVVKVVTVHLVPEAIFLGTDVDFVDSVPVGRVEALIAEVEGKLRGEWPVLAAIYIKPVGQKSAGFSSPWPSSRRRPGSRLGWR